jgi:hypothetical protein
VRILFWNVRKLALASLIAQVAHQESVDVVCLAESEEPIINLSIALNTGQSQQYLVPAGVPLDVRRELRILARLPAGSMLPVLEDNGITVRRIVPPLGLDFNLIALHLRSKLYQDPADQVFASVRLRAMVDEVESEAGHRRTVIVGDLNMDPFERGVVAADGLHAVMSRRVAANGSRQVDGNDRYFFYNPMWSHFGERLPSPPGTFFRGASGQTSYFWHMFDQVLVRPDLLPYFDDDEVRIITKVGTVSLLTPEGIPNKVAYSDHLPLVFELAVEKGLQNGIAESMGEAQAEGG